MNLVLSVMRLSEILLKILKVMMQVLGYATIIILVLLAVVGLLTLITG